jgi:hypothetical protein
MKAVIPALLMSVSLVHSAPVESGKSLCEHDRWLVFISLRLLKEADYTFFFLDKVADLLLNHKTRHWDIKTDKYITLLTSKFVFKFIHRSVLLVINYMGYYQ